jgi:hypothetical protein
VGVQIVERWILASLRNHSFFSLTDLNQTIQQLLLSDVNYPVRVTTITLAGFS